MKVLLDSNVWRYVADQDAGSNLVTRAAEQGVEIVVVPALVFEARELKNDPLRRKLLGLLAHGSWKRLMPETYLEAEEIKAIVRRLRPEWVVKNPDLTEVNNLRLDWERKEGGFWSRARDDASERETDVSLRIDLEHTLARQESQAIRQRIVERKQTLPREVNLQEILGVPPTAIPGWLGLPVEYWRVPSLFHLQKELALYASPLREWFDSEVDVAAIGRAPESLTQLWYYEITPADAPRQWTRGAFEFLQAFHKVTPGTPVDSQLSSHLVDVDKVVSADRNFVRFAQKCREDAPFPLAQPFLISGGTRAVENLLMLL
ncbi:MAG: hypothetical protein U1A78_09915 [Polyangia bacterium]